MFTVKTFQKMQDSYVERGARKPSLSTVFKIAVAVQVGVDVLLSNSYEGVRLNMDCIVKDRERLRLKALLADTRTTLGEIDKHL
jgi:uncharacterized protein YmfQ (DUF2313 family)